jgi:hypothetical protein
VDPHLPMEVEEQAFVPEVDHTATKVFAKFPGGKMPAEVGRPTVRTEAIAQQWCGWEGGVRNSSPSYSEAWQGFGGGCRVSC